MSGLIQSVRKSAELAICASCHYHSAIKKSHTRRLFLMAGTTRLELATSCVTGMRSNQTELRSHILLSKLVITAPLVNLLVLLPQANTVDCAPSGFALLALPLAAGQLSYAPIFYCQLQPFGYVY